jgi:hypothetical protein
LKTRNSTFGTALLTGVLLSLLGTTLSCAGPASDLQVRPCSLEIREYFSGAPVAISADIPQADAAVVEIKGLTHDDSLLRKGRRGGLWMNVGEVEIHGAPSVYLAMSTAAQLPSLSQGEAPWGYAALEKDVSFSGALPKSGPGLLFEQFEKLKEHEGLYGVFPGALKIEPASADRSAVHGQLMLPGNIHPGMYTIILSVLNHGTLVEQRSTQFSVEMKGLTATLFSLSDKHALAYGLLAVAIAIVTGFVMGVVFKGKSAH